MRRSVIPFRYGATRGPEISGNIVFLTAHPRIQIINRHMPIPPADVAHLRRSDLLEVLALHFLVVIGPDQRA